MPRMNTGVILSKKRRRLILDSRRLLVGGAVGQEVTDSKMSKLVNRDRISNLPQELLHCILKRLPVHDAARTSVLSKEWRYVWRMNTQLVLDKLFFSRLTSNIDEDAHQSACSRAVELIILGYISCIRRFVLYIPPKLDQCRVALWIELLLKKGIRYLGLDNSENNACETPSCLFDFAGLIILTLNTWILNAPLKCTSFTNLLEVQLKNVTFTVDISFGTQLEYLMLEYCTGIQHLACQFTNGNSLTNVFLALTETEQINWRWFECTSKLRVLYLEFTSVSNFNWKKPISMIEVLSKLPSIHAFYTSGFTVGVCISGLTMTDWLATKVENLKELTLNWLGLDISFQFSDTLDLIRCLPNLQRLRIILVDDKSINHIALTSNLDSINCKDILLDQLHTVYIEGVTGANYVFHLVKILLASSPSLKVMSLICSSEVTDPSEKLKIKRELQNFPRRSLAAQVLWC